MRSGYPDEVEEIILRNSKNYRENFLVFSRIGVHLGNFGLQDGEVHYMNIYYLIAQLPVLRFGENPAINRDYFLNQAAFCLSKKEFTILNRATIDNYDWQAVKHPILYRYSQFEYKLREEISLYRKATREKTDYKPAGFLQDVFSASNPLEAEKKLLLTRWRYLEQDEYRYLFTFTAAIIYFLKLQILEKLFTFNKEKGLNQFDKLCEVQV